MRQRRPTTARRSIDRARFALETGHVKLTRTDADGNSLISALFGAGAVFGPGLLDDGRAVADQTAVVRGFARVHHYRDDAFRSHMDSNPRLALALSTQLARREASLQRRLQAVLHLEVRTRTAAMLFELVTHAGQRCEHGHEVDIPLTQQELAELVGASRPVISAVRNDFRRGGLLTYERGLICVDDLDGLGELAAAERGL